MGFETKQYVRRPLFVRGVQVTAENMTELAQWCQGEIQSDESRGGEQYIKVPVNKPLNQRQKQAFAGDWLLYTDHGGHKVYTPHAFEASFEEVTGQQADAAAQEAKRTPEQINEVFGAGEPSLITPPTPVEHVSQGATPIVEQPVTVPPESLEDYTPLEQVVKAEVTTGAIEHIGPGAESSAAPEEVVHEQKLPTPAVSGKDILTRAEQANMTPEEIKEALQEGGFILEQDLESSAAAQA